VLVWVGTGTCRATGTGMGTGRGHRRVYAIYIGICKISYSSYDVTFKKNFPGPGKKNLEHLECS
jgi:hypothetical protein